MHIKNFIYIILFCIIIIISTTRLFTIPDLKYDNVIKINGFLNKNDIIRLENCYKTNKHLNCLKNEVVGIKDKLKIVKKTDFVDIGHIRWSIKTKNYDGRSYHRDVKPLICKTLDYIPQVYTLAIFLDTSYHYQGGELFKLNPGDAVLFNAFNLHKGYTKKFIRKTPRRVIQVFNIVFSKEDKDNFYKHHAYSMNPYIKGTTALILKHINRIFDVRTELEYYNIASYILKYKKSNKLIKYVTAVDEKGYSGMFDNIKYYNKF